jgi:hypothetical protein
MKKILCFLVAGIACLALQTCTNKNDTTPSDDPCGDERTKSFCWDASNKFPWNDNTFNYFTEGNNRVFQVSTSVESNVCIDWHIKYDLNCTMKPNQTRNIQVRIKYRYGFFGVYGNTDIATKSTTTNFITYVEINTFGIKNAYTSSPGSFYLSVEWVIDNYLDYPVDLAYFQSQYTYTNLNCYYKFPYE